MTLLAKLGIATLGGGSIAVGSYGVYELIRPKTIRDQLKWEGKELGDVDGVSDDTETEGLWHKLYEKYKNASDTDKFKKGEEKKTDATIGNKNELKKHCGDVFKMDKSDEDNLKKSKLWCIRKSVKLDLK